jgi:esterase/lipase superfamily enzyme
MPCVLFRAVAVLAFCASITACAGPRAHDMLLPYATPTARSDLAGTHEIFVATTRARAENVAQVFDGRRSPDLSLARIKVTVPAVHETGNVERPKGRVANPAKYFTASDLVAYPDEAAFVTALRADLARRGGRALVFIHGYNNLFDDAVYRTAQIVHDSGYDGTPVLFSWASGGRTVDYVYDRDSANAARDQLEDALRLLVKAGAKRIDIIAHSMGNLLTVETLRQMAIAGDRDLGGRLGDVVLASPDIDIDVFKAQMQRYGKPKQPFILMLSRDDRALDVSRIIGGDRPRLGGYENTKEIAELGLVVIDLTEVSAGDSLNHAKFADNPLMVKLIGEGLKNPELRGDPANAEGTLTRLGRGLGNTLGQTITIAVTLPGRIVDVTLGQ